MDKWEDISIINEKQLDPHSTFQYEDMIDLNGKWKFRCILDPDKADKDFYSDSYDFSSFEEIDVPACWETRGYGTPYYFGADFPKAINKSKKKIPAIDHKKTYCGLYRKTFTLDHVKHDSQSILRFDSIKSAFYCYVNGNYVGMSKGSMLPCEFDVSDYLKEGENSISVKVYEFSDATYIEDQDMWFLSGIYRDVSLYTRPKKHIQDIFLHSELLNDYTEAIFHCDIKASAEGTVSVRIGDLETSAEIENGTASLSIPMKDVRLWSAEHPELYPVTVTYKDGDITEIQTFRFGFREDRVDHEKALYLHNGKPIKLRGINYHAFTPDNGYYVPEEIYRKDLKLLKDANINAIRTSHYPQADLFYDLCDEMGFYVMDECNVESHGVRDKNVPGDDPRWTKHVVDRMERMVIRDRNHACVSIWSLGNESACGENHFCMKEAALKLDASRPIHYEGGRNLQLSDFLCDGYCSTERERKFANREDVKDKPSIVQRLIPLLMSLNSITYEEYKHHPILVTEYQHSMGNAGSDVEEHVRIMDGCDQYCGGFVWDFKDKALLKDRKLLYGGDFKTKDQAGDFCCNGICDPFSVPHSIYYEIQHAFQPLVITRTGDKTIDVYNRNVFTSSAEYKSYFTISENGKEILKKEFKTDVEPRGNKEFTLDFDLPEMDATCFLNVFFEKDGSSSYQQFLLKEQSHPERKASSDIREDADIVLGDQYVIDRNTGDVRAILVDGTNILKGSLRPSFYRPYTDGDMGFVGMAMHRHLKLDGFGKDSVQGIAQKPEIRISNNKVLVTQKKKKYLLVREYSVSDGSLKISAHVTFTGKKAPNRFGMQLELDKSFKTMEYFGKGPSDHYPGKDDSGLIAIYRQDVQDQDEYVRPQEHGNKTHVYYADVSSEEHTLHIEKGEDTFNFSCWPYTLADLHKAQHIHELPEHTVTIVNIDCIQNGLNDCFVKCDEKYLIKPGQTYTYDFYLSVK